MSEQSGGCSVVVVALVTALAFVVGAALGVGAMWVSMEEAAPAPATNTPATTATGATGAQTPPVAMKPYATLFPLEETLRIEGPLPPEVVKEVVLGGGRRFTLSRCYEAGVERDPQLKGEMSLQFTVAGSNGKVTAAVERHTNFSDKAVSKCILDEIKNWTFPPQKSQSVVKVDLLLLAFARGEPTF